MYLQGLVVGGGVAVDEDDGLDAAVLVVEGGIVLRLPAEGPSAAILEERGVVRRVADEVDRKIAYIEVTDEVLAQYQQEIKTYANFAGGLVRKYGVEKFNTMCKMLNDFLDLFEEEKKRVQDKTDE